MMVRARSRVPIALLGNALTRISGGACGVLVGPYFADLAYRRAFADAALVGTSEAVTGGALLGAVATQIFGMSGWVGIFFLSRAIEGLGAAAGVPPLLAHITTSRNQIP